MRNAWIALAVAGLLSAAVPGHAQQVKGDDEVQAGGSLSLSTSSDQKNDAGSANLSIGRFITDFQQVGVGTTVSITGNHKISGYGGVFYRYNFSKDRLVPYVGVSLNASLGGAGSKFGSGALASGEGGIRYFLDRATAFTVSVGDYYSFDSREFGKQLAVQFGFSHLWHR
jgi:hypothetical protein